MPLNVFGMSTLVQWWPLLVIALLAFVVVRGEPLDLKDALVMPIVLLAIGTNMIIQIAPTTVDLAWLAGLSVISLAFGVARCATIVIECRGYEFVQRYRWTTFALLLASLVVGAALGQLAQHSGMHEGARPLTFTIGLGLAGKESSRSSGRPSAASRCHGRRSVTSFATESSTAAEPARPASRIQQEIDPHFP